MPTLNAAPSVDVDPFSDAALYDPSSLHRQIREAAPVVHIPQYDIYATARFAVVREAFMDPETYCSGSGVGLFDINRSDAWRPPSLLLENDPPEHGPARRVIASVLTNATVRSWEPRLRAEASQMIDRLLSLSTVDLISDLAQAYPCKAFGDLIGLPVEGRAENLLAYGEMLGNAFGPRNARFHESTLRAEPVREWIETCCRPDRLSPDGIGHRIHEQATAAGYGEEAVLFVRSVLSAGIDTTVNALGNALLAFVEHPTAWAALRERPSQARAAFDEAIRYDTPLQNFFRTTTHDCELGGIAVPKGSKILLFLGAANRDPGQWESPDIFDIHRDTAGHVGFGFGIHHCVGRAIARLEGEIVLSTLAEKVRVLHPAGEPERALNHTIRGLRRLPVRLEAV
jgi:hypothetical protein